MPTLSFLLSAAIVAQQAAASTVSPPAADTPNLADELRCAAAFAIVASEQERGIRSALAWPSMGVRGREYFVRVGVRAMDEAGMDREAVKRAMEDEVAELQRAAAASDDPEGTVAAVMQPCLVRLDAVVAPLHVPDHGECAAILSLAYDEVHAAEGMSPAAKDIRTLASVLESRARERLSAEGLSGPEIERRLGEQRLAVKADADARAASGEESRTDYERCFVLAAPEERRSPH